LEPETTTSKRILARCGLAVAILATLAALHLHWVSFRRAGGLWRDEIAITNIATLPSLGAMWGALPHDHCPVLFATVLRGWSAMFGGTDTALRTLGLIIGLVLLASVWLAGRILWRGPPLLSLTLFGLDVIVIRYGDTVRAYGLAAACIVLTMALVWRFVQTPNLLRGTGAVVMATLSVQTLYQNSVLVLALCSAACVVFLYERRWRPAAGALAVGIVPALSLLPYVGPLKRAQQWWVVSKIGAQFSVAWENIASITGHPLPVFRFVWPLLLAVAVIFGLWRAFARSECENQDGERRVLFATVALIIGLVGFGFFLIAAQLPPQLWYFLVPMAFAIVCCDTALSASPRWAHLTVLGLAVITGLLAYPAGIRQLQFRQTNGDLVAAEVSRQAAPTDLIIVNPWYCGLTFSRYYRGTTPWTTLSGLNDYRYHRYDLLKAKMEMAHPARPVLDRVAATLKSGHRVWIVGRIPIIPMGSEPPPDLPPATFQPHGWLKMAYKQAGEQSPQEAPNESFDEPYSWTWGAQLYYLIGAHALTHAAVRVDSKEPVNGLEDMHLYVAAGWRNSPAAPPLAPHESRP
jgi:hypothetical protein